MFNVFADISCANFYIKFGFIRAEKCMIVNRTLSTTSMESVRLTFVVYSLLCILFQLGYTYRCYN